MKKIMTIALTGLFALGAATLVSCGKTPTEDVFYTVSFNADGGSPTPSSQKVKAGETAAAPSTNPTKTGYAFLFWSLSGSTAAYSFQTPVNDNITLTAKWEEEAKVEYWQVTWNLNGGAWTAGDNHATQVVKGGTLAEPTAPTKANSTFEGWYRESSLTTKITFPYDTSALTADFSLYAKWEAEGKEPDPNNSATMVASGRFAYFVLNTDGALQALGHNDYGQLGTGNQTDSESLTQIATGISAVYAGGMSTFIVKTDGSLFGTGYNSDGELGLGDTKDRAAFTKVPVIDVKAIATGDAHTLLLKNDGSLWASGFNAYGRLGVGDETQRSSFTATNLTADVTAVAVSADHSLALKKDGTVWGAGFGYEGVLGEDATDAENTSFVQIFSGAKAVATGVTHSLILTEDGTVRASGINHYGQSGIGNMSQTTEFIPVIDNTGVSLTDVTAVVAGYYHSLALKSDGTLWATGRNGYGQLGTGDENDRNKFTRVATGVKSMSAGRTHSIVVKNDGTVLKYGYVNPYDQLNGSGTILIKVNDTHQYQYINALRLSDRGMTELLYTGENISTGGSGYKISVKPGTYNLRFWVSNLSAPHDFVDLAVGDDRTVTILYEWVSSTVGYKWTVTNN